LFNQSKFLLINENNQDNKCSVCGDEYGRELRADKTGPIKATYKSGEIIEFVSWVIFKNQRKYFRLFLF